jgi:hypothetical protein
MLVTFNLNNRTSKNYTDIVSYYVIKMEDLYIPCTLLPTAFGYISIQP